MKFKLAICGLIPGLFLAAASAQAATIVPLDGTFVAAKMFMTVDSDTDGSFFADYAGTPKTATTTAGAFDYTFDFTTALAGVVNASFSATLPATSVITSIIVDGTTYTYPAGNTSLNVLPFTVTANEMNTIEVIGSLGTAKSLAFAGTVMFAPTAVPEPATWATFLLGFGLMGLGLRRKALARFRVA